MCAIKVRGNLMATRDRRTRGERGCNMCRLCNCPSTLAHTLQVCPRAHRLRIERHAEVCGSLVRSLQPKGYVVKEEPHIPCSNSFLKPDIVAFLNKPNPVCPESRIHSIRKILVLDPIVVADNADLDRCARGKSAKYSGRPVRDWLLAEWSKAFPDGRQADVRSRVRYRICPTYLSRGWPSTGGALGPGLRI